MTDSTAGTSPTQLQAELRTLLEGPAMSPPAGVIPDFDHAPNLDIYVAITITLCFIFATLTILLRMYTKVFILRVIAWEDCRFTFTKICSCHVLNPSRCHRTSMGNIVRGEMLSVC